MHKNLTGPRAGPPGAGLSRAGARVKLYALPSEPGGVARRLAQLAAALVLVGGVLGVSTALIDQVRDEVLEAEPPGSDIEFSPPTESAQGLPLHAFTLLDPAPAHLANRTVDASTITLTSNGTLSLSDGDTIQPAPIPVPPNATATFPAGGVATDAGLACPDGCRVETSTGPLSVPSGVEVDFGPAEAPDQDPRTGETVDLPDGARLLLDPITVSGPTPLPLLEGSTIRLPGSQTLAGDADTVELPEQTRVQGPTEPSPHQPRVDDLRNAATPPPDDALEPPAPVDVTITSHPTVIEKTDAFHVEGRVETPTGEPSQNHPVTVYANATLERRGTEIQLGAVATDAAGRFNATARLPADVPVRPYHLVAEAHGRPGAEPATGPGYASVEVPVTAQPRLSLDVPDREGARVPWTIGVEMTDTHGAPVPNRTVLLDVDGASWSELATTGPHGRATVVHAAGLPHPGNWTVEADFGGTEHLSPASASSTVRALDARIDSAPTIVVPRGETSTLAGRVHHEGDPGGVRVHGTLGPWTGTTLTEDDGRFTLPVEAPEAITVGNHTLTLETEGVTAIRTVVVTVTGQVELSPHPPPALPQGARVPVPVTATTTAGDPVPGLEIQARVDGGPARQAVTDAQGRAVVPVGLEADPVEVEFSTDGTPLLASTSETVQLTPAPLRVEGEPTAGLGEERSTGIHLSAVAPLANQPVRVHGPGFSDGARTDADGRAELNLAAPADTAPGNHRAFLALPGLSLVEPLDVTVLDQPDVTVEVLSDGQDGTPVRVRAHVTGAQGPLSDVPVHLEADGAFQADTTTFTDANGTAILELDRPRDAEGTAQLSVTAQRTSDTASAQASESVEVTGAPFPWWTLALAGIPLAAGGVYLLEQRSTRPEPTPTGPTVSLRLADQEPGWPPAWHPGEPARLVVRLEDADGDPLPGRAVHLDGPKGGRQLVTDEAGLVRVRLPPHEKGVHTYTARFDGDPDHAAAEATVELRVVDYREEIDREFVRLRRAARRHGYTEPGATPHELAGALGGDAAHRMARIFERCDYSNHEVTREHYERFMRAKEACAPDDEPAG